MLGDIPLVLEVGMRLVRLRLVFEGGIVDAGVAGGASISAIEALVPDLSHLQRRLRDLRAVRHLGKLFVVLRLIRFPLRGLLAVRKHAKQKKGQDTEHRKQDMLYHKVRGPFLLRIAIFYSAYLF